MYLNPAAPATTDLHKTNPRKLSLQRVKMIHDAKSKQTHQSVVGWSALESLAKFLNSMSFLDSHLSQKTSGGCKSGCLGVKVSDSLLDELSEEEVWIPDMERWFEIQAVVEGLGFCSSRSEACEMKGSQEQNKGLTIERNTSIDYTTWNSE